MQKAEAGERQAGPDPVAGQQVEEAAGVLVAGVDREPVQQVAERDSEQQRRQQAPDRDSPAPAPPPRGSELLVVNSIPTPRAISAIRTISSGR